MRAHLSMPADMWAKRPIRDTLIHWLDAGGLERITRRLGPGEYEAGDGWFTRHGMKLTIVSFTKGP